MGLLLWHLVTNSFFSALPLMSRPDQQDKALQSCHWRLQSRDTGQADVSSSSNRGPYSIYYRTLSVNISSEQLPSGVTLMKMCCEPVSQRRNAQDRWPIIAVRSRAAYFYHLLEQPSKSLCPSSGKYRARKLSSITA